MSTTSTLFRSRREATSTSSSSQTVSVVGPICSPSLPPSSPLRPRPTFWSTNTFPYGGVRAPILSDNGLQFCSKLSQAVYQLLGVRKLATSSYHPNDNGGVERVNHTMTQMLAMVVNERQDDWHLRLPHVEFAYNNSVSAAKGLAPNEVHMGLSLIHI